ncbi:MAG: hydroxymethylbilane synthase [Cyanobacteria bacterium HKST-UBA05]|nr:hydroxymethylbilane synthase [Cyanobacteria bacterium HKST-UBA05]
MTRLVAGSRKSPLAMAQTRLVIEALQQHFGELQVDIEPISTQGDERLDVALSKVGDKGLFVKELETALLEGRIDFAIHSMKDMPGLTPEGLTLMSTGKRANPFDALVSHNGHRLEALPPGALIGTSSLRRQAFLSAIRPDLRFTVIRGNVQTRLAKVDDGQIDATLLAAAGLQRLGLDTRITHVFDADTLTPACCQGTLAVEFANPALASYFHALVHGPTEICCKAERAFLLTLEGGCQVPMAAFAQPIDEKGTYRLQGVVCSLDGSRILRHEIDFEEENAHLAGHQVASILLEQGAADIIAHMASRN